MDSDEAERLGASIRTRRKLLGMTIVQLAESARLSHPFVSQLERGLARPSFDSLGRIAHALGSSQIELLSGTPLDVEAPGVQLTGASPQAGTYGRNEARILVHGDTPFTPIDVRGARPVEGDHYRHAEAEFATVIVGEVDVDLGPEGVITLRTDESLYIPGGVPHRWGSHDGAPYRMLVVKERLGRGARGREGSGS